MAFPSSPAVNDIFVMGANKYKYMGSNIWTLANGLATPAPLVGRHSLATAFNTVATHTTLQDEGLTVTANDVAGTVLRFSISVNPYCPGGQQGVSYRLLRDGVAIHGWDVPSEALSTSFSHGLTLTHSEVVATTHANSVYKVQIKALTANTQVSSYGDATYLRQLVIEDITATSGDITPIRHAVRCRRTTNQTINNSSITAISWDTEDEDIDGMIAVTGTTFTVKTAGSWMIEGECLMNGGVPIVARFWIQVNLTAAATGLSRGYRGSGYGDDYAHICAGPFPLAVGDTFSIDIFQSSGGSATCNSAWMGATRVGP